MVNSQKNKTVVDAVNALQGNFYNAKNGGIDGPYLMQVITNEYCDDVKVGGFVRYTRDEEKRGRDDVSFVCLEREFNQCVAEMSEGLFVPDCRPKQHEIQYDDEGNGWEIGAVYEFSDDGYDWVLSKLDEIKSSSSSYKYHSVGCGWRMIRVVENTLKLGGSHKKPVELVDGAAYQFELEGIRKLGIWHNEIASFFDSFSMPMSEICTQSEATNIIKLVPESI